MSKCIKLFGCVKGKRSDEIENLEVPLDELESRARERRIYDVSELLQERSLSRRQAMCWMNADVSSSRSFE